MNKKHSLVNSLIISALLVAMIAGGIIMTLFNMSEELPLDKAEKRVRVCLTRQMSEKLIQVNNNFPSGYEKEKKLAELAEQLKKINATEITSIQVKKLFPDILIRPHKPTYIVRVEIHTNTKKYPPRYFLLSWTNGDSETTETAWYFSF